MSSPEDIAAVVAATQAGYAASKQRQDYYTASPGGVPAGVDPPPDPYRPPHRGLGYSAAPDPAPVFVADRPGLVPSVLPVPPAVDTSAPVSLTGASHGGFGYLQPQSGGGDSIVYASPPRRRTLWSRLTGRGR